MDPISIAGLSIAVLDQVWKLSERTAVLISNFRDFDKDTINLENKIKDEMNRAKALRRLLFDPSPTYGGKNLFEQFDEDVQERIQMFFEQSMEVIDRAFQLLNRRYNKESKPIPASSLRPPLESSAVLMVPGSPQSRSSSTDSLVKAMSYQRLRWSLTDKRRVEAILRDFSDYNSRVTEHIKLWTIASNVGLHLQHLQHLENDHDSQLLGFNIDAKLAMVADNAPSISKSLEIKHPDAYNILRQVNTVHNGMGIIDWNDRPMLVEYRSYNPTSPVPVDLDSRTKDLVNNLAALLHEDKGNFFRTPICEGWIRQASQNRVAFLFVVPEGVQPKLTTLLHALQSRGQSGTPQMPMPTLEQRFELAHKLSRSIAQLQLVKWVHESFRSENILFFPQRVVPTSDEDAAVDWTEPWVLGFEFSRPEFFFSDGHADFDPNKDIYRHPERQQHPSHPFKKLHDIYALGVVLLEIGLWQPAITLEKHGFAGVKDPKSVQDRLIKIAERKLAAKVGSKYQRVVLACLRGDFDVESDTKEDLKLQLAFRSQVVDALERMAASV